LCRLLCKRDFCATPHLLIKVGYHLQQGPKGLWTTGGKDGKVDKLLVFFTVVAQIIVLVVEATLNLLVRLVYLLTELIKVVVRATLQTTLQILAAFFDFLTHITSSVQPPGSRVRAGRPRRRLVAGQGKGARGIPLKRVLRGSIYFTRASFQKLRSRSELFAYRILYRLLYGRRRVRRGLQT